MAWTKNLGKVKGETGDTFLPDIEIKDGYLHYSWVKKTPEEIEEILTTGKNIHIPLYVPREERDNQNNLTGNIIFELTEPVRGTNNQFLTLEKKFYVKGDKGDTGDTTFNVVHFTEPDVNQIQNPQSNTIYVQGAKAWFYDAAEQDFFMLEGIDLSKYYLKTQTYSKTEINDMFNEVTSQLELAYKLLEINETILPED